MDQSADIPILFCDDSMLVINKPAGIATLPDGYDPSLPHIKSLLEHQYGRLWIVHRMDKETSGVLLLARSAPAHRSLNDQFEQRLVSKTYHAVVHGLPDWQEKTVDMPLKPNGDRQHRTVVDPVNGKPAVTHFTVLEGFIQACLLVARPETGRTHQIRAHLAAVGLSIIGDKLYTKHSVQMSEDGFRGFDPSKDLPPDLVKNMALHAISLEFNHPVSGERMEFTAPYPSEMLVLIQYLRNMKITGQA